MPHFRLETNVPQNKIPSDFAQKLCGVLSKSLGKPISYCVATVVGGVNMSWGGKDEPAAQATLMSIGALGVSENKKHSKALFEIINKELNIPLDRGGRIHNELHVGRPRHLPAMGRRTYRYLSSSSLAQSHPRIAASEAVAILNQQGLGQITGASLELIASDVLDHYRTYSLLEKLLSNPSKLHEQLAFQIEPQTHQLLIEKYYEFDDNVARELLGKKLSSKHRKDLDEICERTSVPLKSCRRQFDNLKRIFKTVEEMPGSLVLNIQKLYSLSEDLARRYAAVVFLACLRFETSKRKLQHLSFPTLKQCSESVMDLWTYTSATGIDYFDTEMDKEFLLDLRELKVVMEKEKEHKSLVCSQVKTVISSKAYSELESNFRSYSRPILTLATSLHRVREMRNFFYELSVILDNWKHTNWTSNDLEQFLNVYTKCALSINVFKDSDIKQTWERYMNVVSKCLMVMYVN
ncbi:hypothetical protein FQR65_LT18526 [Abscondita terminalis]|nr:hypothetical protein FQR65_LT18526 [Abscondita terminalis]